TQRSPPAAISSTCGPLGSGEGATSGSPARPARRSLGRGRFGIWLCRRVFHCAYDFTLSIRRNVPDALLYSSHIAAPHHEGWRDWPEETPATPARSSLRKVPNPAGGFKAWKM